MMDLIDRQAAIDAMKDTFKGTMVGTRVAVNAINRLPSAEPNLQPNLQPTCNQLATDCISRQGAIDAVNELTKWYYETFHEKRQTAIAVIDKLMDLPSAEPTRCQHCKYFTIVKNQIVEEVKSAELEIIYCQECIKADLCAWRREGAEYCSYAKKKKDE